MSYVTVEVEIEHDGIVARGVEKPPEKASGLLTVLPVAGLSADETIPPRKRAELPLIRGDGKTHHQPTSEDLGASLWGR